MNKFLVNGVMSLVFLVANSASADFNCINKAGDFELDIIHDYVQFQTKSKPAVAVIKENGEYTALHGEVLYVSNRVEVYHGFKFGEKDELSLKVYPLVTTFVDNPFLDNCGRGACNPKPIKVSKAPTNAFTYQDKVYQLQCTKSF